jgi:hypothetical protein
MNERGIEAGNLVNSLVQGQSGGWIKMLKLTGKEYMTSQALPHQFRHSNPVLGSIYLPLTHPHTIATVAMNATSPVSLVRIHLELPIARHGRFNYILSFAACIDGFRQCSSGETHYWLLVERGVAERTPTPPPPPFLEY